MSVIYRNGKYVDTDKINQVLGAKGDPGPQGPKGDPGPLGPQGETGPQGAAGTTDYNNLLNKPDLNKFLIDYSKQYLTFEAIQDTTFTFTQNDLQYSLDDGATWTTLVANTASPTVSAGNKILWKATDLTPIYLAGIGTFSATGNFKAYGNIMSLYYGDNFDGETDLTGKNYAFYQLFESNVKLVDAKNLILPATTLDTYCYFNMFKDCIGLITAPELPATTLANNCYQAMFQGCTGLITAPELPATTLTIQCYQAMFSHCKSLKTAPELPATTLTIKCYPSMFSHCKSLKTAPELPATILTKNCYDSMFYDCTSLTTAPELPATTLSSGCYYGMFRGCTGLTTAPELPATTLDTYCYFNMFKDCTSLNFIKCLATHISAIGCTYDWIDNVAPSGIFIKEDFIDWSSKTGANGIPTNWNVYTESKYELVHRYELTNINDNINNINDNINDKINDKLININKKVSPINLTTSINTLKTEKINNNSIYKLLIPIDSSKNIYTGDIISNSTIIPYIGNNENYLLLQLGNIINENSIILEANLTGSGFYCNSNILYNNGNMQIYSPLPLNLIKDNLQYLMISYYIKPTNNNLYLWFDDFADGDYSTSALNDWVLNNSDSGASDWNDYVENYLLTDYPSYKGSNCYSYTNETFEWNGEKYYLWECIVGDDNIIPYILTETVDYDTLYGNSLENDYTNHWCPYVVKFKPDGIEYLAEERNDILIKVTNTLHVIQDAWVLKLNNAGEEYKDWEDYCDNWLLNENEGYGQSNEYLYIEQTFTWNGIEYYLWEDHISNKYFILTDTINYQELYDKSIEANHYNMNCPYVAMLFDDKSLAYEGSERKNDWLIKVTENQNTSGQAQYIYTDTFVN